MDENVAYIGRFAVLSRGADIIRGIERCAVINGDGDIVCWAVNYDTAKRIAQLLNLAYDFREASRHVK